MRAGANEHDHMLKTGMPNCGRLQGAQELVALSKAQKVLKRKRLHHRPAMAKCS